MYSPLEQFNVTTYIKLSNNLIDFSINKTTIYIILSILIILWLIKSDNKLKTNNKDLFKSYLIITISNLIKQLIGKIGFKYIPFILTIWIFILLHNELGLIPYSYTITSQFIITGILSLSIWIGITLIGLYLYKLSFINLFIPQGIPKVMIPFISIIEIISYFSRIISLSVRLSANMISGHTILKILSSFGIKTNSILLVSFDIFILTLIIFLEIGVGFIQSFVFTLLVISYLKDIYILEH